jgi:hypothetical protein
MSLIRFTLLFVASAALLWAFLTALVLYRKRERDRRERTSRARRARYRDALDKSDEAELAAIFGELANHASAQLDMMATLRAEPSGPLPSPREADGRQLLSRALVLQSRDRDPVARGRATLLLSLLGLDGAVDVAASLLRDEDPDVRLTACSGLAQIATDRAAAVLIGELSEDFLRPERLIERLGAPWATDELLRALSQADQAPLRAALARALGLAPDPRSVEPLVELLEGGNEEERINAARSLAGSGGPEPVVRVLGEALEDRSASVRAQAARSIGGLRPWASEENLASSHAVAERLRPCLGDQSWWVRANAGTALRGMGQAGISVLREALNDPDRFARDRARESLALYGGQSEESR